MAGAGLFIGEVVSSSSGRVQRSVGKKPHSGSLLSWGLQSEKLPSKVGEAVVSGTDEVQHPHLTVGMCSPAFCFVSHGSSVAALEEGSVL